MEDFSFSVTLLLKYITERKRTPKTVIENSKTEGTHIIKVFLILY